MNITNEVLLKKLLATFAIEAKEHIDNLSNGLLKLKKTDNKDEAYSIIETMFREAHSFKGASRSVNITETEELCKAMEDAFGKYKSSKELMPRVLIETMLDCNDLLTILVEADSQGRQKEKPHVQQMISKLHQELELQNNDEIVEEQKQENKTPQLEPAHTQKETKPEKNKKEDEPSKEINKEDETLRVSVKKLNAIMQQAEEMLYAKITSKRYIEQLKMIYEGIDDLKNTKGSGYDLKLKYLDTLLKDVLKQVNTNAREIELNVDRLIEEMKEALMSPFSTIFFTLPKVVHDMTKSEGKEIDFEIIGGDIEIDRRILEQMHDPIIHLLRNAVGHGIEDNETRIKKGKTPEAKIQLSLKQISATKLELKISDDGAGIDIDKVKDSAIKNGIVSKELLENMTEQNVTDLVFQSGVTTAKRVTDLSGRGLGLAIVQEKAEALGGYAHVVNKKDGGCEFSIILPFSMATFRGVVVSQNEKKFIFPSEHIVRIMNIESSIIKHIESKTVLQIDNQVVPFYLLSTILEFPSNPFKKISVVVLNSGKGMMAIGVDEVESEEEIMVKSLGKQLVHIKNIAGAALLSSDVSALILNIPDLFRTTHNILYQAPLEDKQATIAQKEVLVVDDSPTTRVLLYNILEMSGYSVTDASDGSEAYELLKKDHFDIVVSDVDMPIMDGIELVKAIRENSKISEIPIILVTSLDKPEDKQKGMEAGADAYIIKTTFNQTSLIEQIELLLD